MYDYKKIDDKVTKISSCVSLYIKAYDKDYIEKEIFRAYNYARNAHEWQMRLSWDPYIIHPVEATLILLSLKPDIYTIQACLLHDVIEDTKISFNDIKKDFWEVVAFLCEGVSKLSSVRYKWEERNIWSLRKMFIAMAEDLRVIFIKIADRCHNMQTLYHHPNKEKRLNISIETLNIFAPIADRLWLYHLKNILEEESLRNINPIDHQLITKELKELKRSMESFTKDAWPIIKQMLIEWEVEEYKVDYRIKSVYSIYKKMKKKWLDSIKSLYDLFWIRIIVKNETTCYKVLWLIHKNWNPLPNRFKDYIALPKPNWYRSLHTTIIWLLKDFRKQPTEIQIKTYDMMEFSDIWVAAHFEYKEKWSKVAKDIDWVKDLKEMTENLENNDFIDSLKIDIFKDRIFVFTPKWDLVNLPASSTAIDFAYYLHSDLWDHISIVKINWIVKTLDKELKNWDVVEIITNKNNLPNPFWLSFVKTNKAKNRIKSFIKNENKDLYRERWKDLLNKYLQKASLPELDKELLYLKSLDWRVFSLEERWQLLEQVWNFSLPVSGIFKKILKNLNLDFLNNKKTKSINIITNLETKQTMVIWWEKWLSYKLAKCCIESKIDSSKVVAHINKDWLIHIHKRDCNRIKNMNKDRLLSAYIPWNEDSFMRVDLQFDVKNEKWILRELSDIIYKMDINIEEINFKSTDDKNLSSIYLTLELPDYDYLIIDRLIERVKNTIWDKLLWFKINSMK